VSRQPFAKDVWRRFAPRIRQILWAHWDPIRANVPEDEYDSYIAPVLRLLEGGADRTKLAARLSEIAEDGMACPIPSERAHAVAEMLLALGVPRRGA
jgi:hypothetical protein